LLKLCNDGVVFVDVRTLFIDGDSNRLVETARFAPSRRLGRRVSDEDAWSRRVL
jgi:hypothetical protein